MSDLHDVAERPALTIADVKKHLPGEPKLAEAAAHEYLKSRPDDPEGSMLLGAALRLKGDAAGAKDILAPLVEQQPDWAEVRLELGLVLGMLGENHAAIKVLTEAVNIDRNLSAAWSALGEQYVLVGDVLASDAAYSHHFNVSVHEPALQRAVTALRNGRPDVTEDILIEFLDTHPDHVNAIKMLAEAAIAQDRNEDASALLERCLELAPDFSAARYRLCSSLYLQNRLHEAIPHIDILLEKDPLNPQFRTMKASVLGQMGEDKDALALFEGLVEEYPNHPASWISYGHALKGAGKQDEGVQAYRKAIELLPQLGGGYWSLANLKTFRFTDADIAEMHRQIERGDLRIEARVQFFFSLGKAYRGPEEIRARLRELPEGQRAVALDRRVRRGEDARLRRGVQGDLHPRVLRGAPRLRPQGARSDLRRRPAPRRLDAARANPLQPFADRGHDGAARYHVLSAAPERGQRDGKQRGGISGTARLARSRRVRAPRQGIHRQHALAP